MSLSLLTLFQFLGTLAAYLFVTLAIPCAMLGRRLSHYRLAERLLFYFIFGNFYATNLVFLLQLLYLPSFFMHWVGLLVIPAAVWAQENQYPLLDKLRSLGHSFRKLLTGTLGIRSVADTARRKVRGACFAVLKMAWNIFRKNWLDCLLTFALFLMVMWVYGISMFQDFGYKASDVPVHLQWVNGLSENQLYAGGIYPLGMHAVIYLINECFGIDTYVVFRVFALVQCLAIHMMALLFLKLCCKSRYAAYPGVFLYTIVNIFATGTYLPINNLFRYLSALPQETSMLYILPTAYYAMYFFQEKRREIKEFKAARNIIGPVGPEAAEASEASETSAEPETSEEAKASAEPETSEEAETSAEPETSEGVKASAEPGTSEGTETPEETEEAERPDEMGQPENIPEKSSRLALAGLIMSFSLCVTAHFYGAIIAVVFCIGIAVGFAGWLLRPAYFKKIIAAALISVAISVFPMAIAYAVGTPLQGSLFWAVGVITESMQSRQEQGQAQVPEPDLSPQPENTPGAEAEGTAVPSVTTGDLPAVKSEPSLLSVFQQKLSMLLGKLSAYLEKIKRFLIRLWEASGERIELITLREPVWWYSLAIRGMIAVLIVIGAVLLLSPARMYGATLLSTGVCMFLMSVLFAGRRLGLPNLMEAERTNMFFSYLMIIVAGLSVDVCVCAVTVMFKSRWPRDILSFAVVLAFGWYVWQQNLIRLPLVAEGFETNEAITCLTNIIATEPDNSWTIFSANDETQMVYGHGYHYELITFLQQIETLYSDTVVTVPTQTVYFFIEKKSLTYWSYGYSQPVSREGAEAAVPRITGLEAYTYGYRWIVMSHMYYWAQEFQRLYPNEMKVYMETDDFICYCLKQNPYSLFNLAIDYGYNHSVAEEQ